MNWQSETRAWALATAGVFCLSAIGYRVWTAPALPDLAPTVARTNKALDTINHPCAPGPCGTLANLDKLTVKAGDITVALQHQVMQSGKLVDAASGSLTSTATHLNAAVDTLNAQAAHLGPAIDAARDAAASVAPAMKEFPPLLANASGAVTDVRDFVNQPLLKETLADVANTANSTSGIAWDFRRIADKETDDFMKPVKWYMRPMKRAGEFIDIGAALARNVP